jgi:hypothetical protein
VSLRRTTNAYPAYRGRTSFIALLSIMIQCAPRVYRHTLKKLLITPSNLHIIPHMVRIRKVFDTRY